MLHRLRHLGMTAGLKWAITLAVLHWNRYPARQTRKAWPILFPFAGTGAAMGMDRTLCLPVGNSALRGARTERFDLRKDIEFNQRVGAL